MPIDGRTVMSDVHHLGYTTPISKALRAFKAYRQEELGEEIEYVDVVMYSFYPIWGEGAVLTANSPSIYTRKMPDI